MTEPDLIVRRVLDAVPARSYAMNALLSLVRIEVTNAVPTAAVSCARRPVLLINPEFVDMHCDTDEHLFLLVMHELHHVLLGHTRLFPRPTPAHNLAFDAVINAMLVARFPQQAYTSFFTGIYGDENGALRLLAPPGSPPMSDPPLRALHEALYGTGDVTSQEVFERITQQVASVDVRRLLGSHDSEADLWGTDSDASPELIDVVRSIVEKWPPPENAIRGRSLGDILKATGIQPVSPHGRALRALRAALFGAASRPGTRRTSGTDVQRLESPLPHLRDRRATVLRCAGRAPLLNAAELPVKRRAGGRADVYLDVSGSLDGELPALHGALRTLREHVAPTIHLFSTEVAAMPLGHFCDGSIKTTGGTDIRCVLEHIATRRPKKALVITDGYVGRADAELASRVARVCSDIRVLLTPGGWRPDLESIASRIDELPNLEGR